MGIKFDKNPLAIKQNTYLTKIVNVYIVYGLDAWPRNLTINFEFKNCLFAETNIVKNSDRVKHEYSRYGRTLRFSNSESREVSLNGSMHDFSVD